LIVIDKKLHGVAREFAMFHELSHALLSSKINGPQALFMGMCDTREEDEADAFAAIALIPLHHVADRSFLDDCCCGTAERIYEKRLYLYQTYGV
jgi:Zn-dependent peptidase ImmA (M78 family)